MTVDEMILWIAFTGLTVFFVGFSLSNRKWENHPVRNIIIHFISGFIVSSILTWLFGVSIDIRLLSLFLYSLLVCVYIFAIYLNIDSSIHMRIFQTIAHRGINGLTYQDLLRTYNKRIILERRLTWLVNSKELAKVGSRYFLGRRISLLDLREKFLVLLIKLYGTQGKFDLILLFILLSAFLVRVWGINFGLPDKHFGDEQYLIYWAFYSGSHYLAPPYYLYAPLVPTILLIEYALFYVAGIMFGSFSTPLIFFTSYLSNPIPFFQIGRLTMVMTGVATVWLTYVVGKTFFNIRVGHIASLFLAFTFLHVKESHYIKQDVMMGFFVLAAFYYTLKILKKGELKEYLLCGIAFGLAVGAKYQAVLFLPVIFLAHFFSTRKIISKALMMCGFSAFLIFCLVHPYFFRAPWSAMINAFSDASGTVVIYAEHLEGKPVWWWFVFEHLPQGMGYPLYLIGLLGLTYCGWCAKNDNKYLFISLLPLIFFITIDTLTALHFARYVVLLLPFFMLAAAIFVDSLLKFMNNHSRIIYLSLVIVLIFPSAFRVVKFNTVLTQPDTRTLAKEWFEQTVPNGSKVLVESTLKPEIPSSFNMSLMLDEESVDKRIHDAEAIGQEGLYLRALKQVNQGKIGYDIVATTQVGAKTDIFTDELTRIKDVSYYLESRVSYIVLTSWVQEKMSQEFSESLNTHYRLIQEFRPTYEFKVDPHLVRMDYEALDKVNIFQKDLVFGPVIRIYELKLEAL